MERQIENRSDFTLLFNNHFNHLVIYLMRYVQDISVAKDIAQDIFVLAWEKRSTIKIPSSFLFVCAKNAALKYLSNHPKSKYISTDDFDFQSTDSYDDDTLEYFDRLEKVGEMVNCLPPKCGEVIRKVYFERKKISDVANEMSLSENTVKTHIKIAKKNLSKLFVILLFTFSVFFFL